MVRAVEINVVVVVAIEEIAELECPAQADEMTNGVGVPEGDVGGVISAETRAADTDTMGAGFAPREIEHIVHNHIFISNVAADAIGRMNPLVVKTVEVE